MGDLFPDETNEVSPGLEQGKAYFNYNTWQQSHVGQGFQLVTTKMRVKIILRNKAAVRIF